MARIRGNKNGRGKTRKTRIGRKPLRKQLLVKKPIRRNSNNNNGVHFSKIHPFPHIV
jgi:hypothetical protein